MAARYFAVRRLNPYRGVVQIVDTGDAEARSFDGEVWHLRAEDGQGLSRPAGVWSQGEGLRAGSAARLETLLAALAGRPSLPFHLADSIELWLLDKEHGLPLALLDAQRPTAHRLGPAELEWMPFALPYRAFHSPALAGDPGAATHRDALARMVNARARPYAAAQWFRRRADGSGEGLEGYRARPEWSGRRLPAEAFPPLLVEAARALRLEQSVIRDYHAWLSPFLLCWPSLPDGVRGELEVMACQRPRWLLQVHRLLPRVIDTERIRSALVAARIEHAAETCEHDIP